MVDQNANAPASNAHKPQASGTPSAKDGLSQPSVIKAGEAMLIISLVLIFLVCCTVAAHLYLKRQKRRKRGGKGTKKGKKQNVHKQPELPSQEKPIAELVGTPMCEIGDSDPRHEMEDAEVDERYLRDDNERETSVQPKNGYASESGSDSEIRSEIDLEVGISWYGDSEERVEPDSRELAMYWSRGI